MKKSTYFIIQVIWSVVLSSAVWYLTLINTHFDFYHNSDDTLAGMIIFFGSVVYVILTVVQIIFGVKKVKKWRWWVIPVSLLITAAAAFGGLYVVVYGTEFLNKIFR